jgi:hypothetical protein
MYKVCIIYGKDVVVEAEYTVSTKKDAETLIQAIDDAQGYLDYELISMGYNKEIA